MTCESMKEKIALHATGDLPSKDASIVEQHLDSCAACQTVFDEMKTLHHQLGRLDEMDVPAIHARAILDAAEITPARSRSWRVPAMATAVAAVLLIAITLQADRNTRTPLQFQLTKATQSAPIIQTPSPTQPDLTLAAEAPHKDASIMVKLYTDDPDVVIYWWGD